MNEILGPKIPIEPGEKEVVIGGSIIKDIHWHDDEGILIPDLGIVYVDGDHPCYNKPFGMVKLETFKRVSYPDGRVYIYLKYERVKDEGGVG